MHAENLQHKNVIVNVEMTAVSSLHTIQSIPTPLKIVSLTSASFQCPGLISSIQIAHAQSICPDADSNSCMYQHSVTPK